MNTYDRLFSILLEAAKPTRASKKTQAAEKRAAKKEANVQMKKFKSGTLRQRRGK